jgi:hypothetical protein
MGPKGMPDTKTYWLTDRQSWSNFDFDFDFDFDSFYPPEHWSDYTW